MFLQSLLLLAATAVTAQDVKLQPEAIDEIVTPNGPVGSNMPKVGFGTWMISPNTKGSDAVARAIKMGYRHFDGATAYTNQGAVGKGIAKALIESPNIKREHLWVTSKIWTTQHKDVPGGVAVNLQQLGLDYVDLMLIHFPIGNQQKPVLDASGQAKKGPDGKIVTHVVAEYDYLEMWKAMEKALEPDEKGFRKVRHIGISNFNVTQIDDLLANSKVKPFCHQYETHPYLQDWKFLEYHEKVGIPVVAYAPLGNTNQEYAYRNWKSAGRQMIQDPVLKKIATARDCTPAQVSLVWNLARNVTVIPKAENVIHQVENYEAHSKCKLTTGDLATIKALDKDGKGGRRYWDMCCYMSLPCYHGLQDGPTANEPALADYCTDAWHTVPFNKERADIWTIPTQTCQRPVPV